MRTTKSSNQSYSEPVWAIGLALAIYGAISPVFSREPIRSLFIDYDYSFLASLLAFAGSVIAVWLVLTQWRHVYWQIGKVKDRGKGYLEPAITIADRHAILLLALSFVTCSIAFFSIHENFIGDHPWISLLQVASYILGFMSLSAAAALLVSTTSDSNKQNIQREYMPETLFETLTRNGYFDANIKVHEKRTLSWPEANFVGASDAFTPQIVVATISGEDSPRAFIFSSDGRELIKEVNSVEFEELERIKHMINSQNFPSKEEPEN